MYERHADVPWTDEQWNRVCKAVSDEAQRVRTATKFLPVYGPVDAKELGVPNFWLQDEEVPAPPGAQPVAEPPNRLRVESLRLTLLTTIAINIHVRTHEAADPELGAVMTMFRRAANLIARTEDALMFNGQPGPNLAPTRAPAIAGVRAAVTGGQFQYGLLGNEDTGLPTFGDPLPPPADGDRPAFEDGYPEDDPVPGQASRVLIPNTKGPGNPLTAQEAGQALVGSINHGISLLEQAGYTGPFACVLGNRLFETAHEPTGSFVMPRDRILPVLMDGPLLRSSLLANEHGILVAYGSGQVEQVLASDICVKLLHVSGEPRYVFRICERVTLRVRDWNAVVNLC